MTVPHDPPGQPDGPTPAREQLPLPRRRRQSHLEPQLRHPGSPGTGTPFTPFAAETTGEIPVLRAGHGDPPGTPTGAPASSPAGTPTGAPAGAPASSPAGTPTGAPADRAAA
ncbi:MAG TPA: hypothetical protein VD903_08870, partial [Pseudonocardia sp.]|nr:hypothetical protein [Pseudonocardia sp.]